MTKTFKSRLRVLIYPKFQLTLVFGNLLVTGIVLSCVMLFIDQAFSKLRQSGVAAGLPVEHTYYKFLEHQSAVISKSVLVAFVVGMVISAVWMLFLSHRLAGPVLRLRGFFGQIARGEKVAPVSFRKGDFFVELPPVINEAIQSLKSNSDERNF